MVKTEKYRVKKEKFLRQMVLVNDLHILNTMGFMGIGSGCKFKEMCGTSQYHSLQVLVHSKIIFSECFMPKETSDLNFVTWIGFIRRF